jgi:hypothetical protein
MIIRTDIKNLPLNKTPASLRPPAIHRNEYQAPRTRNLTGPTMERSLGDALSIAQVSQGLIQRVLAISLRLKNIATEAMSTGKLNMDELNIALADIKSTLGGYGESIANPPQASEGTPVAIPEVPDLSVEMRSIQDIAADMKGGASDVGEKIETLGKSLNEKSRVLKLSEEGIVNLMRESAPRFAPGSIDSGELLTRIKADMEKNPGQALAIQGNIRNQAAGKLFS